MDRANFGILNAARDAYLFAAREWRYLLKAGMMPVVIQVLLSLLVQFQFKGDVSSLEAWLWGFPATVMMAWYSFIEVRLLLLGERIDRLTLDKSGQRARRRALNMSVTVALLFNMVLFISVTLLLALAGSGRWGVDVVASGAALFLVGFMFWGLRLALLPTLAAVEYPFRAFVEQVRGPFFSLRLLALGALCLFPVAMVAQVVVSAFFSGAIEDGKIALSPEAQAGIIIFGAFLSLVVTTILNAAGAFALRQVLGGRGVMA